MSRLSTPSGKSYISIGVTLIVVLALAALAPSAALGEGIPLRLSAPYSSKCHPGESQEHIDPVGVLFRGTQASAGNAAFEVQRVAEWEHESAGPQQLRVKLENGKYGCKDVDYQPASEPDYTVKPLGLLESVPGLIGGDPFKFIEVKDRFHVRLWFVDSSINATERKTVGTPHHEKFVESDCGDDHPCKGALKAEVAGVALVAKGTHAVDAGGGETGIDSGFDLGRQELRRSFEYTRHQVKSEK